MMPAETLGYSACDDRTGDATNRLPDALANRAQPVPASVLGRWIRDVAARDRDGFAVISGAGTTHLVLYVDGVVTQIATHGDGRGIELGRPAGHFADGTACFAVTHRLPRPVATALTGLFHPPSQRFPLANPRTEFRAQLSNLLTDEFHGCITVDVDDVMWFVLVVHLGQVVGSYESDDRAIRPSVDAVSAMFYGDDVWLAVFPAAPRPDDDPLARLIDDQLVSSSSRDDHMVAAESDMIELLSRLEFGVASVSATGTAGASAVTRALATAYSEALSVGESLGIARIDSRPVHPLLDPHWVETSRSVDTARLISSLEEAGIDDVWYVAVDALATALEHELEQQLAWLALADVDVSAAMQDALQEILRPARDQVRRWRDARFTET